METKVIAAPKSFEIRCAIALAFFAGMLATADLFADKYDEEMLKASNEKTTAFMWYQAKSIKEATIQGQRAILETLIESGAIAKDKVSPMQRQIAHLAEKSTRYEKEMKEILVGSKKVERENWVQDVDGRKGAVIGAGVGKCYRTLQ